MGADVLEGQGAGTADGECDARLIERARRILMSAVPGAAEALSQGAIEGSAAHIKLLLQLLGLDDGVLGPEEVRPSEKTLEAILMEQWHKEP